MPARVHPIVCPYSVTNVMAYYVDAPTPALIDTGGAGHPPGPIRAALRARGADLDTIEAILNTHGHWDHAGGNAAFRAGATIHRLGAPLLRDRNAHLDGYYTMAARAMEQPEEVARLDAALDAAIGRQTEPARLIEDGDTIDLGDGVVFRTIHAPGHSADMTALYWEREGVLIAGDAAQGTGSRVGSGPLYFHSVRDARASIARLREVPFATLHVSHPFGRLGGGERATTFDRAGGLAFLDESLAALDAIEEALRAAQRAQPAAAFPDLARAAAGELRRAGRWPLAVNPATGMPDNLAPTLYVMWREGGETSDE
ncbi:MAG TPA: MBL fold metallo-hydrolase [Thermomicrobiales bacterium]|nr:MBL fold metallo-hydrolase [Thermomicrobiales bacterium]